jgi:hypothetical protein
MIGERTVWRFDEIEKANNMLQIEGEFVEEVFSRDIHEIPVDQGVRHGYVIFEVAENFKEDIFR